MRVAIFDLDGTITRHDTFLPYLRGWLRRHPRPGFAGRAVVALLRSLVNGIDRGRLKSDLVRAAMRQAPRSAVDDWTRDFVSGLGPPDFCPGALAAIDRHRAAGDRLVLLSASLDLYVPAIGARLGFDEAICTGIAWRDGRVDGGLTTANRRGNEKARCVQSLRARHPGSRLVAYGNSPADFPHLALVDEPLLVNGMPGVRRLALSRGIPVAEWRNKTAAGAVHSA